MIAAERLFADLQLVPCLNPGRTCAHSPLLMARLVPGGKCELLSPAAWARALGYAPEELSGKYLSEIMPLGMRAAGQVLADLLDPHADAPVRCKDDRRKHFRFYRRFDDRAEAIFLVADELG